MLSGKTGAVIPAFNEEENAPQVMGKVHEVFPQAEIVVVGNDSMDQTMTPRERGGICVLRAFVLWDSGLRVFFMFL